MSYAGTKTFLLHKRVGGSLRRLKLGNYPAMSLSKARQQARQWKDDATAGLDPKKEAAKREAAEEEANTFGGVVEQYLTLQGNRLRPRTLYEYRCFLKSEVLEAWQHRPIESISRSDLVAVLDKIDKRGNPSATNHGYAYLRSLFNWAVDRDLIASAPTDRMRARHTQTRRDRVLSPDELKTVVEALDADEVLRIMRGVTDLPPLTDLFRDFFRVLLLTGQRRGEVAGMEWAELDLDGNEPRWELPPTRTKNRRRHIVPLAPAVVSILKGHRRKSDGSLLVFSGTGQTPISGFGRAKARLDKRVAVLCEVLGRRPVEHWTAHDLRRTAATIMSELGVPLSIVEATLNHVSGTLGRGYRHVHPSRVDERASRGAGGVV